MFWFDFSFILGAYLLGSVPQLYLLGLRHSMHLKGDLHMALWQKGRLLGIIGVLLDMAKGAVVVLVGRRLHLDIAIIAAGGVASVAGQMWPIFFYFDGEKGNSIGLAMCLTLTPIPFLIALVPITIGFLVRTVPRFMQPGQSMNDKLRFSGPPSLSLPFGMAIGFAVLPLASWWMREPLSVNLAYTLLFLLILLRRATARLNADINGRNTLVIVIFNRLLYDRAEI